MVQESKPGRLRLADGLSVSRMGYGTMPVSG